MTKSPKDVEAVIEDYLRKKKFAGNIDEFISACQNLKALILDVTNKRKIITSKDIFNNTRSTNTLKELSSLHSRQDEERIPHNLKECCLYRDQNTHNIHIQSFADINRIFNNKPNDVSNTGWYENPPTLRELKSSSDDIMNIIAKLKVAHLISPSVDKHIQTEEFLRKVSLFNKGVLEEFEKSNATTSRKQNDPKLEIFQIKDNNVSELKVISSDDDSNTSTVIEKPTKLSKNTNDDKTPNHLRNATIVEETENDLHTVTSLQQNDHTLNEIVSDIDEPQTCKCVKQIVKQEIDAELTNQNKTECFEEGRILNIIKADVDNNNQTNSRDSLGLYQRKVRKVIKTKRRYNKDGTINEVTETVIVTKHKHDPTATTSDEDIKIQPVMSDEDTFDQFEKDDVNFFTAPKHNMQGFIEGKEKKVKKGQSSNNCKVARRAESYIRQCLSCSDIVKLDELENEAETSKTATEENEFKRI